MDQPINQAQRPRIFMISRNMPAKNFNQERQRQLTKSRQAIESLPESFRSKTNVVLSTDDRHADIDNTHMANFLQEMAAAFM